MEGGGRVVQQVQYSACMLGVACRMFFFFLFGPFFLMGCD